MYLLISITNIFLLLNYNSVGEHFSLSDAKHGGPSDDENNRVMILLFISLFCVVMMMYWLV